MLQEFKEELKDCDKIKILDHVETNSFKEIKKLHDQWVKEGFEGLVARKPTSTYQFGKRGSDMIKVKEYMEQEFEIVDYKDGLRDEDFCFILQTDDGKLFSAKPTGTREDKDNYLKDIDNIIGKKGTVKFFEWSKDGVPQQPVFQTVRDYE
jgi:DNA ligase-1